MSTNYYHYEKPPCPHCGREYEPRHIGLSAAGWAFQLHVYPDEGINDLAEWSVRLMTGVIKNEYGEVIPGPTMHKIIVSRNSNVTHAPLDNRVIRNGFGTWDCVVGDFS